MNDAVHAVVQRVISGGRHGPYAVARSEKVEGSITFSLLGSVWQERVAPEPGEIVYLTDLRRKRAGWRAMGGRYLRPSDQQTATRRQQ